MTQAYGGLKSLKPNRKPIKTPLRLKVSKSFYFPFQSRERTLASILEISTISVPRHKEESLNRRSWCLRDSLRLWSYLYQLESRTKMSNQINDLSSKYQVSVRPEAKKVTEKSIRGYFGKIGKKSTIYRRYIRFWR